MPHEHASAKALIDAYFQGWNAHDPRAIAATFAPGGTHSDPTTSGPVAVEDLARVVEPLCAAFPDLAFELGEPMGQALVEPGRERGATRAGAPSGRFVVEWLMRGRNLGEYQPGIAPTGKSVAVPGVAVFELAEGGIRRVRWYFDQKTFVESFGLMALVQPVEQGAARYGYSMRVASGNPRPPSVIALTWIQGADEAERERIRAHSRDNVRDFLAEPGFVSIVTGFTGLRGFTVTAWEDEASMRRALAKHHAVAMRELFGEPGGRPFVAAVWTSVWTPTRMNRLWVRCPACGSLEDVNDDHRTCGRCHAPMPERPAFW